MHERRLNDAELAAASHNLREAKASLACEGIFLTPAEDALFQRLEDERLPHDECRRQILAFCRASRQAKAAAAE
jgi:hypothetical protein